MYVNIFLCQNICHNSVSLNQEGTQNRKGLDTLKSFSPCGKFHHDLRILRRSLCKFPQPHTIKLLESKI